MNTYKKNGMFQVHYYTRHETIDGRFVDHQHETRVFADNEIDAECKVADRHPDGFAFWAVNCKDLGKLPNLPHSLTWSGSY
jgi:hypothetical protein